MPRDGSPNRVLAIVAALNEEEGIGLTIVELRSYLKDLRILVVDGKSRDRTVEAAKNLNVDVLVQRGNGKGDAIARAMEEVNASNAKYIVLTDADYTYPAEYLLEMLEILDTDPEIGMVCGNRFNAHFELENMHNAFYLGNRLLAFTHNLLNGVQLRDPLTGLRVLRSEILKNWTPKSKGFDIEVELNHRVERCGYRISEIPIFYRPRLGEKKLALKHGVTILKRILMEAMS